MAKKTKVARRKRIHQRIRGKISGTAARPRVCVFRSNLEIYAQVIDDHAGVTLATASSKDDDVVKEGKTKTEHSKQVGEILAKRALEAGVTNVVFDRNGYLYHGRVQALADGAREGGLKL